MRRRRYTKRRSFKRRSYGRKSVRPWRRGRRMQ